MSADRVGERKGYLGLKFPAAVMALVMAAAAVCSMNPSIGRPETGIGSFLGGNLCGSFRFQYVSGNLYQIGGPSSQNTSCWYLKVNCVRN